MTKQPSGEPPQYSEIPPPGHTASATSTADTSQSSNSRRGNQPQTNNLPPPIDDFINGPPNTRSTSRSRPRHGDRRNDQGHYVDLPYDFDALGAHQHSNRSLGRSRTRHTRSNIGANEPSDDAVMFERDSFHQNRYINIESGFAIPIIDERTRMTTRGFVVCHRPTPNFRPRNLPRRVHLVDEIPYGTSRHRHWLDQRIIFDLARAMGVSAREASLWTYRYGVLEDGRGDIWLDPRRLPPGLVDSLEAFFERYMG
ncbi:hypothetical protein PRK78_004394 [Emydomyces testavorans]|uniref:Uncharacterized protein n=1 Tax=Emydomyces testavorans TaxID=2070801 RepID=A0AAF0DK54_9EURO|nr:hypothetical protein PRK78_004394 [Emydomyces testavorans]